MSQRTWEVRVNAVWNSNTQLVFAVNVLKGNEDLPKEERKRALYLVRAEKGINSIHVSKGQIWEIVGKYDASPELLAFGDGFSKLRYTIRATHLRCLKPRTGEEFIRFVDESSEFKGIGPDKAREIWLMHGQSVFEHVRNDDYSQFDFLSPLTARRFIKACQKYATIEYAERLISLGFNSSVIEKIIKFHGVSSIEVVCDNPYIGLTFGMSFNDIDNIARNPNTFGIDNPADARRLAAAVEFLVNKERDKGHTVTPREMFYKDLRVLLGSRELAIQALDTCALSSQIKVSEYGLHAFAPLVMEHFIAQEATTLANVDNLWTDTHELFYTAAVSEIKSELQIELTPMQENAVKMGMLKEIFLLTGGVGTGKTIVLNALFKALRGLGYKIYPMALSGRVAECIKQATGHRAQTIHSAIRRDMIGDADKAVVVIDEASMLDTPLLFQLMYKTPANTRYIFVGDSNQLPPVSFGLVLHDFVRANCLPHVELDVVKRPIVDTGIPEFMGLIKDGIVPEQLTYKNITFHPTNKDDLVEKAVDLMERYFGEAIVIAPSISRVTAINRECQVALNPAGIPILNPELDGFVDKHKFIVRKYDPVIFTRNIWDKDVQNGTMGQLVDTERTKDSYGIVITNRDKQVEVDDELLEEMNPAYGISLHHAQGSQFERIIVVVDSSRMIDRSWVYTALTCAKAHVDIIGYEDAFVKAIKAPPYFTKRRTFLWQLLNNPDFKTAALPP
ncbi:AAA family ATPase [Vibrio parahaemolyticus]|nr:AAA family ATPase [Vibrio parahaemolyticus]EIV8640412.1 AAA family ATPase [Vibrio parahaemolyticus]EIY6410624.1 AAA family ATPase [Vibrio parahaemolyticus]EJB1764596.1 AAA family ATPase [Vibrio parahaemolyticus]